MEIEEAIEFIEEHKPQEILLENGTYLYLAVDKYNKAIDTIIKETIPKQVIKDKLEELRDKEQELTDEQGYWGNTSLLEQIELLEELLGE